jgi:hypothetical protein
MNPEAFRRAIIRTKGVSYIGYLYQDALCANRSQDSAALGVESTGGTPNLTATPTDYRSAAP